MSPPTRTSTPIWAFGFIPVDSVHSPVRRVNYLVEAARLGQITDYDKLTLEVWTNTTAPVCRPMQWAWLPNCSRTT